MDMFGSLHGLQVLVQAGRSGHQTLKIDDVGAAWPKHLCQDQNKQALRVSA
jgi:hypothetical protein